MGASAKVLKVIISGDPKGALKAMDQTGKGAGKMGGAFSKMSSVASAGLVAAGAAAVGFAVKSAHTYQSVGQDILGLQRVTGLSAESASKLRYEFQQVGIKATDGGRYIALFGKKLAGSKDSMKDFGFRTKDASGHLLPMQELLARAADRLSKMSNVTERNALAMKLFGKGGVQMTKLLDLGRTGMSKLAAEAKKYGLVLTKDNLTAVRKSIKSHRQQEAAMQGLQVQIGQYVLPVLTKLVTFLGQAIPKVAEWVKKHQGLVKVLGAVAVGLYLVLNPVALVVAAIAGLVVGVRYAYKHWAWFRHAVDATVKFFRTKARPAIKQFAALIVDGFRRMLPVIRAVWTGISAYVKFYIAYIRNVVKMVMSLIHGDWGAAWDQIKGLARGAWENIKAGAAAGVSALIAAMKRLPSALVSALSGINGAMYNAGVHLMAALIHGIQSLAGNVLHAITSKLPGSGLLHSAASSIFNIAGFASGGSVKRGQVAVVGENGPELVRFGSSARVYSNAQSRRMASGGGGGGGVTVNVTVQGGFYGDVKALAEEIRNALIDKQRMTGRAVIPAV